MSPSKETEIKILFSFLIRKVPFQLIILQTVYQLLYQIHSNSLPIGLTIIICYSSVQTVSLSFCKFYSLYSAILFFHSNNFFIHLNGSPIGFNNLFIRANGQSNHLDAFIHYPYIFPIPTVFHQCQFCLSRSHW